MDDKSMIQYIVNGIQDSALAKAILYDSTSLDVLKLKLKTYETIKAQRDTSMKPKSFDRKSSYQSVLDSTSTNNNGKRCYNCGSRSHQSHTCPDKSKGTRCFNCNHFGHRAKECTDKKPNTTTTSSKDKPLNIIRNTKSDEAHVTVRCHEDEVSALADSGSPVTLMKKSVFDRLKRKPYFKKPTTAFKGFGNVSSETLGSAEFTFIICDDEYDVECHIVRDDYIDDDMLIGRDILLQADFHMRQGKVVLKKIFIDCDQDDPQFINQIRAVDYYDRSNEPIVDLDHIKDIQVREEVQTMIKNYSPKIPVKSCVQMKVCLTDEVPVYEKPRRLAPKEKEIVNTIIKQWLEEGICRPSNSPFSSAVVLRPKKIKGAYRLCIDFCRLNRKVIRDRYPLPIMDEVIDVLQGAVIYSILDLRDGFFHVDVEEDSIKYLTGSIPEIHQYNLYDVSIPTNCGRVFRRFGHTRKEHRQWCRKSQKGSTQS